MIGEPGGAGAADEALEFFEAATVERFGGAEVHGDAVLDDAVLLEDLVEDFKGTAAVHHEIFGDDLEPIDDRLAAQDMAIVRNAQADADAIVLEAVERIGGHSLNS